MTDPTTLHVVEIAPDTLRGLVEIAHIVARALVQRASDPVPQPRARPDVGAGPVEAPSATREISVPGAVQAVSRPVVAAPAPEPALRPLGRWLTPERFAIAERGYPAGESMGDLCAKMAALPGPPLPAPSVVAANISGRGLKRPAGWMAMASAKGNESCVSTLGNWRTPARAAVLDRGWPAGDSVARIRAEMAALDGPPIPADADVQSWAQTRGLKRSAAYRAEIGRQAVALRRDRGFVPSPVPSPPTSPSLPPDDPPKIPVASPVVVQSSPAAIPAAEKSPPKGIDSSYTPGASVLSAATIKPKPAPPPPVSKAVQPEKWPPLRLAYLREHFPAGVGTHDLVEDLNRLSGAPLTKGDVLSRATVLGLARPAGPPPQPSGRVDATWGEVRSWCAARGMQFVGDMEAVNHARRRAGLAEWVLVEPFGPGSAPGRLADEARS